MRFFHCLIALFSLSVIMAGGCASEDTNGDFDAGDCSATECFDACLLVGYEDGGLCVDGECVCEGMQEGEPDAGEDVLEDPVPDGSHPTGTCDIDILFVVDTSGSMMDAAENLAEAAFPNFAGELETYPELGKYRVAVTTHLYGQNEVTDGVMVQDSLFLTQGWPVGQPHDAFDCEEVPSVECGFGSGESWMVGPSSTLHDEFACVGRVACHQNVYIGEPTLQAGLEALRFPDNSGFLREDALLVVVYITDEDDQSTMAPAPLRENILALKGGDEKYVVVLTLGGPMVGTVEVNSVTHAMGCISDYYGATEQTPRLIEFSGLFGARGLHYNLCDDDISSALTSAIDALETSCGEILI